MNAGRWIGALILKTVQFHLTLREMYPNSYQASVLTCKLDDIKSLLLRYPDKHLVSGHKSLGSYNVSSR